MSHPRHREVRANYRARGFCEGILGKNDDLDGLFVGLGFEFELVVTWSTAFPHAGLSRGRVFNVERKLRRNRIDRCHNLHLLELP